MILKSDSYKHYHSAHKRFIKPAIENFFETEFPKMFGPCIRSNIADKLLEIFYANHKDTKHIKPGQILWNAIDKNTRADSPRMKTVPVILTMVDQEDIYRLENGSPISEFRQHVIARITQEAFSQGGLLSMRDIALMMSSHHSYLSKQRKNYELKNNKVLPHTGNLHDVGTCITHKYQILYKYVVEKKSPLKISYETNHSIKAVESYLRDYNRVKTLYLDNNTPDYIKLVTNIPRHVILQYLDIINQYVKEPKIVNSK